MRIGVVGMRLDRLYYGAYTVAMDSPDLVGSGVYTDVDGKSWEIIGDGRRDNLYVFIARPSAGARANWPAAKQRREERWWQRLIGIERAWLLRTGECSASVRRHLKWKYHALVREEIVAEERRVRDAAIEQWEAGPRLCTICDEVVPLGQKISLVWSEKQGLSVPPNIAHDGCCMNHQTRDGKGSCYVCGQETRKSTYVEHHGGMHAELWLCDEHSSFETAKRAILEWRRIQLEAITEWEAGPRLCAICEKPVPSDDSFAIIWPRESEDIVPSGPVHDGCTVQHYYCDNEGRCVVCHRRTGISIYVHHRDGMHAEEWYCSEHRTFDTAKKVVLKLKAKAKPGMPSWFGSEESVRARALVEGDDLIVVHEGDEYHFALKDSGLTSGAWCDPASSDDKGRAVVILQMILSRMVNMVWKLKEEILELEDDEVPKALRAEDAYFDDGQYRVELADEGDPEFDHFFVTRDGHAQLIDSNYGELHSLSQCIAELLKDLIDQQVEKSGESTVDLGF